MAAGCDGVRVGFFPRAAAVAARETARLLAWFGRLGGSGNSILVGARLAFNARDSCW